MAIAVDENTAWQTTSAGPFANNFTTAGSNRILIVGVRLRSTEVSGVSVTFDGAAMTEFNSVINVFSNVDLRAFYLINPALGTKSLSVSYTGTPSSALLVYAASYTGALQSGQPDSSANNKNTASTSLTTTTTVVLTNCWLVGFFFQDYGTVSAGAGTTIRDQTIDGSGVMDSNGAVSTGSQSLIFTVTGSANMGAVIASIAPAPDANSNFLTFMGPQPQQ